MLKRRKTREKSVSAPEPGAPRHLRRFLRGTFDHYSSVFQGHFSLILDRIFGFLFNHATISDADRAEIRRAAEKGAVCFVIRSRSRLEYLMLSFKLRREGLPYPQFCHYLSVYLWQPWTTALRRIVGVVVAILERQGYPNPYTNGFVERLVAGRTPTLLPLHHFRGLPRRFSRGRRGIDPLEKLLAIRRESDQPIVMVPIVPVYGRRPDRETTSMLDLIAGGVRNPGALRRLWMMFRFRKHINIKVAQPVDLEDLEEAVRMKVPEMVDREPEIAYHVRRALLEQIEIERKVVLGPARKSRAEMVEMVLHDRAFVAALMRYCKDNNEPFIETRRRARRYLEEMAADLRPGAVGFIRFLLDRLLPRVYESVEVDTAALERVRHVMRRNSVIFVPSHKSHIDYLILGYTLDRHNLPQPFTVSGINLNFWPIGAIFRNAGAFFIRRTFRGKRIYTLCLVKYLEMLLREDISLTFYVEGGRSRIGKLIPPKTGFIQYLLEAAHAAGRRDLAFVPVSIGYERIFEERFYTNEAAGQPNEGENLSTLLRHRRMLTKSRGRVWIDFAAPVMLGDVLWSANADANLGDPEARRRMSETIAHRVVFGINRIQPVTPYAIVAEALLAVSRRGVTSDVIARRYNLILDQLQMNGTPLPQAAISVETILATMVAEKVLSCETDTDEDEPPFYVLDEAKRLPLTIYANTVVPHHQEFSLLSLALLGLDGPGPAKRLADQYHFLTWLMKREFVLGPVPNLRVGEDLAAFDKALGVFESKGWVEKRSAGLVLSKDGRFAADTFAAVVLGYIESYHLAAQTLLRQKDNKISDKEIVKTALRKGRRLVNLGELNHPEAVHKIIIESALRQFASLGLVRSERDMSEKTKAAGLVVQVADFVRLREIAERTKPYLPASE